jgi:hypothetical protein
MLLHLPRLPRYPVCRSAMSRELSLKCLQSNSFTGFTRANDCGTLCILPSFAAINYTCSKQGPSNCCPSRLLTQFYSLMLHSYSSPTPLRYHATFPFMRSHQMVLARALHAKAARTTLLLGARYAIIPRSHDRSRGSSSTLLPPGGSQTTSPAGDADDVGPRFVSTQIARVPLDFTTGSPDIAQLGLARHERQVRCFATSRLG